VSFDLRPAAWNLTSDDIGNADREIDRFAGDAVNEFLPVEELVERYRAGATLDDLATLCGDKPHRIRRTLVVAGVAIRPPGPQPFTPVEDPRGRGVCAIRRSLEDVVERYHAGASLEDLAILCRCSAGKVRSLLVKAGVELRPKGKRSTMSNAL
jgi:hypothetical protein